ncbi:SpoIID/LytB domain-containing protein [Pseudoflavonifractor sp. MSJ-37]|uniref:SpoIID/LytB domain-containing protein n=1 Tax=Pseudoflavonifractor sp. MSJ-37 TaxID=2841531 RepID=UPI001C108F6E|nr:SpoIID/LytB domain-containing protein [Pseudoflavonifractor sp. MSJ-37]MBU5434848.1 SpoIID/LytB domain-containing protein [Pseudoflavonifractor sp. MSJ-37]
MKRRWKGMAALCLTAALSAALPVPAMGARNSWDTPVRVGLYYGSTALATANLENSTGSGYRLGYFDDDEDFVELARTSETKISMLKAQNIYLSGGTYNTSSGSQAIGCWHIRLAGSYGSFSAAQAAADGIDGGFPAWIDGEWQVRTGAYLSRAEAESAMAALDLSGDVVGTSAYAVDVAVTGTTELLFQFDGGADRALGVLPDVTGVSAPTTWFKGYKYYGGFRYERIGGGDLTVVNILDLEDYIDCVISQEMSSAWPLEALKAQACAARTYALGRMRGSTHSASHFDLCASTHCQAYPGMKQTADSTRRAAAETAGQVIEYNGSLIDAVYFSHDGGATESAENVWNNAVPYLLGKTDPYEASVAGSISNYNWTVSFTADQLTAKLRNSGRSCAQIVDLQVTETTPTGNVKAVTFTDAAGKTWTFQKEQVRNFLGLRSQRYSVSRTGGTGVTGGGVYVNGSSTKLDSAAGLYAIDGTGTTTQMSGVSEPYVITGSGTAQLSGGNTTSGSGDFVISGSGWGHQVGMSQYGANAMAKAGYTYDQILRFYYTGVDITR